MARKQTGRVLVALLWVGVVAVGLYLSYTRYRDAVNSDMGTDLRVFVSAAEHLRHGESPFLAKDYVYSPLVAWVFLPLPGFEAVAGPWTFAALVACWMAVACALGAVWRGLRPWQRPVLAAVALFTILFNYALALHLWLGQIDTMVLALLAFSALAATRRWGAASGVALALAGIVKTWPAAILVWLLRRGAPARWTSLIAAAATWVLLIAATALFLGPHIFVDWIQRTFSLSQQSLVAYSVLGLGRQLFTDNPVIDPIIVAPLLGTAIGGILALGVIALIILILFRPGDDSLSMWNITSGVVLLIPVSHIDYRLLMLPLLWVWLAHALAENTWSTWGMVVLGAVFWYLTFRIQPIDSVHAQGQTAHYVAVMAIAVVMFAASVLLASRRRVTTPFRVGRTSTEPSARNV